VKICIVEEGKTAGRAMPNREQLHVPAARAHGDDGADVDGWVFVAFCMVGFFTTVFFVALSSMIG
jgi:hypothetical protein